MLQHLLDGKRGLVVGVANGDSIATGCARAFRQARAASGIAHFDELIDEAKNRAPARRLVTIEDVGGIAAGLVSDAGRNVTGNISYVDAGYHVMS